ncbi:MAG TPA: hypothetical protein VHC42_01820 [Rhizomicrobium sp.]|nr:hypothetical protein [Rhizomicrobium sp.]
MRAFGNGDFARGGRISPARIAAETADGSRYRTRRASDAAWPARAAYRRRASARDRLADAFRAVGRLIVPVLLLLLSFAAIYLYLDTPLRIDGIKNANWITIGHLLPAFSFLAVHLTNRRYGPAYAFAQVVVALAAAAAFATFAAPRLAALSTFNLPLDGRLTLAFAGAFFGSSFVSIIVFDGWRGPRWWVAPLFGMTTAAALFCLIYYPAAYYGLAPFTDRMLLHMELLLPSAIAMVVPYWMLRRLVRPLPGFGGY